MLWMRSQTRLRRVFDDEVEDENLADQLNVLAEVEAANEGEIISAAACSATMQAPLQAYAAWDNVGIRRPKGKGQPRQGKKGNGREKQGSGSWKLLRFKYQIRFDRIKDSKSQRVKDSKTMFF